MGGGGAREESEGRRWGERREEMVVWVLVDIYMAGYVSFLFSGFWAFMYCKI